MKDSKWIVSAKWDLCFFTGSVVLTYLYYAAYKALLLLPQSNPLHQYAAVIATLVFYSIFDHPHIFQTLSRTHADSTEFERRRFAYTYGLFLVMLLGYGILIFHLDDTFEAFLNIYGIWHILRQNSGFLRLYKKRAGENTKLDAYCDYGILYGSVFIFLALRVSNTDKQALGWIASISVPSELLYALFNLMLILYALRQLFLLRKGLLHGPKLLFLLAIISTYYFTYVISDPPFGLLVALETLYHDVQYQGWVLHFQRRRFGLHVWKKWLAASLLYGLIFGSFASLSYFHETMEWFLAPFIMLVLFHYYIDGRIWRFSNSPELKKIYEF